MLLNHVNCLVFPRNLCCFHSFSIPFWPTSELNNSSIYGMIKLANEDPLFQVRFTIMNHDYYYYCIVNTLKYKVYSPAVPKLFSSKPPFE